MADVKGLIIES